MTNNLILACLFIGLTLLMALYRAVVGPSKGDRLIAINVIGTKTLVLMAVISLILKEQFFLDVVLVYALISFTASLFIAREIGNKRHERNVTHE
ncbi:monovalent cation/H+ antiporter complex subunit F [Fusibacter sp. JL216-2]|uniref:monovalent cation/H+ antiporter complex subunit F n=1 Tax=Fusibacter sp. JL216-2 TaxID=3071453 RepID=UPI003D33B9DC